MQLNSFAQCIFAKKLIPLMMPKDATGLILAFVLNVDEYRHKTVPIHHTLGRLG